MCALYRLVEHDYTKKIMAFLNDQLLINQEFRWNFRSLKTRPGRILALGSLFLATLWILNLASHLHQKNIDSKLTQILQSQIIQDTEQFRNFEDICYAGYCGPWIEEYFMNYFFSKKDIVIDRLYLPISWTNCHLKCSADELNSLREYIKDLDVSKKYFTILQIDRGLHHPSLDIWFHNELDLLIFSAGGITQGDKIKNVFIPLLKDTLIPTGLDNIYKVSFVGSITHPIRNELQEMYGETFNFTETTNWKAVIEQSTFSLCPRGFGATSFRLYEAIQLGSIPIYVWDEDLILAFSDILDWNSFSIIVHRSQIASIEDKIEQLDSLHMHTALGKAKDYFTYEYTCKYILEKLKALSHPRSLGG